MKLASRSFRSIVLCVLVVGHSLNVSASEEEEALLNQWLKLQSEVTAWQADFVQTRKIPALASPLETEGTVYFQSPSSFRWEIGNPARTIALRTEEQVTIYYPHLNRAEQYSMETGTNDPWKDALAMLDAGFPKSREDLERRFELKEVSVDGEQGRILLVPRKSQTRKFLSRIELRFRPASSGLTSAEFEFGDGTVLRNDFSTGQENIQVGRDRFQLPKGVNVEISKK